MSDNKQNYLPTQVEEYSPNPSPSKTEADLSTLFLIQGERKRKNRLPLRPFSIKFNHRL